MSQQFESTTPSALDVVIMAAGKGTRMKSSLPKVLHRLAGRPLVWHVLDTAARLGARNVVVVTGHGASDVEAALVKMPHGETVRFARQMPQMGTGHAVQQAAPLLADDGTVIVLSGDVPLISEDTLRELVLASAGRRLALLTIEFDDPTGYGRIVRAAAEPGAEGEVTAIVEQKDADAAQRAIREVYSGVMAVPTRLLKPWLARLDSRNAQGEFYLTDIVGFATVDGVPVVAHRTEDALQVAGVNSAAQLAALERALQLRQAQALMAHGVRLADPARLDVRGTLVCESDVEIDINCVFEGAVSLGAGVRVGAHCVIANARIDAGAVIHPFTHRRGGQRRHGRHRLADRALRAAAPGRAAGRRGAHRQLRRDQELDPGRRRQGQPPGLPGRRHGGRGRQLRRRQHHGQLRRRQQAPHHSGRRGARGQQLRAGGAGDHRRGRDHRRRLDHHQEHRSRCADDCARPPDELCQLAPAGKGAEGMSRLLSF